MAKSKSKTVAQRWRAIGRRTQWILLGLCFFLLGVRLALPYAIKSYVNHQLDKIPEYGGKIGDVDVHLYRGAYQIQNIEILKTTGSVPVPFFAAQKMDLSLEWGELFHGALVGEVVLDRAELNFVAGPTEAETQTGKDKGWGKTLESLFPFKLNRFEVRQSQIHFRDFHSDPKVDISVVNLTAVATNLTNSRETAAKLPAGLVAQGQTPDGAEVAINLQMNPLAELPTFELSAQLTNANLTNFNDLLKAYGKFDVERGNMSLFTSAASTNGIYDGYVKVLFKDLDVFAWEKERKKNVLEVFWQAVVGATTTIFKNLPKDQLATKVPFSGSFEDKSVGILPAVGTLLRNAFVRALLPKLDETVTVEKVVEEKIDPATFKPNEP